MKPHQQLRRVKISERCYRWLIWFYPAPFRATFGESMRQVFRDQCSDAAGRRGGLGLVALWLRTLFDFAWTCPKEHVLASSTLPRRTWQQLIAKPVWLYPLLATIICLLIVLIVAFQLPQFYSSSAVIYVRYIVEQPAGVPDIWVGTDRRSIDFEKPDSKAVLNAVVERMDLQTVYQRELGMPALPSTEEAIAILLSRVSLAHRPGSGVVRITVYDNDQVRAKTVADEILNQYRTRLIALGSAEVDPSNQAPHSPSLNILKLAEESDRLVRPELRMWTLRGGTVSFMIGGATLLGVAIIRRKNRLITLSARHHVNL